MWHAVTAREKGWRSLLRELQFAGFGEERPAKLLPGQHRECEGRSVRWE